MLESRRGRTGIAVASASLALAAAACAPAGSPADEDDSNAEFVIARTGDIDLLDPHVATAFQTVQTLGLVYGTLVRVDPEGEIQPGLASDWTVSEDGKTVTFTLREGVKFHNGETFEAADAQASLERLLDEKTGAVGRSNLMAIDSIDTPDEQTVVLDLTTADSSLLYALAAVNTSMLDEKDIDGGTVDKKPNGTGPFAWVSWKQNRDLTLEANSDYWDGAPELGRVVFRVIPDESSILAAMQSGNFQMATISDPSIAQQVSGDKVELVKEPSLAYHALMLNGRRPPLDKLAVRQAIACAIDRQQVVDTAANGDGEVTGPITSPAFEYDPAAGLPCTPGDLDKARQLLASEGYGPENPVSLNTIVMTGEYATSVAEGQNLQAQLKEIGVQLELEQEQTDTYVDRWLEADYDAAVALNGGNYSPYTMYGRYFTTEGSLSKPAGLTSEPLDELLTKGNQETDEAAQQQTYQQLQETLLELSPWVWLFRADDYYLISPKVQGFTPMPDQSLRYLSETSLG